MVTKDTKETTPQYIWQVKNTAIQQREWHTKIIKFSYNEIIFILDTAFME